MYNIALVDDDQRILQIVQYKVKSIFNSVGIDPTITCFNNCLLYTSDAADE